MITGSGVTPLERSARAEADLDEILTYSTIRFGDPVATDYYFSFEEAFELLRRHPRAGRDAQDEAGAGVRCLAHRAHRIFYEIIDGTIFVLRILHQSMDVESAMRSD